MITRTCPACKRSIQIEFVRWTRHTDPATWAKGKVARQCSNAEKLVSRHPPSEGEKP